MFNTKQNTGGNGRKNPVAPSRESSVKASQIQHHTGPTMPITCSLAPRAAEYLAETDGARPVWVRAPKSGLEFHSSTSRSKLYEWAGKGFIRSVSIREPGQVKGCRLFNLGSILDFIASCEVEGGAR